jgi:hypothetical protein
MRSRKSPGFCDLSSRAHALIQVQIELSAACIVALSDLRVAPVLAWIAREKSIAEATFANSSEFAPASTSPRCFPRAILAQSSRSSP